MKTVTIELTRIAAGIALLTMLALSSTYKDFAAAVAAEQSLSANASVVSITELAAPNS